MKGFRLLAIGLCVCALLVCSASAAAGLAPGWRSTQVEGQTATLISCSSHTFCVAAGGQDVYTYNGKAWSRFTRADPLGWLTALSCPSNHFCVAGDDAGKVVVFDGTSWNTPRQVTHGAAIDSISCPASGSCVVATAKGTVVRLSGTSWSSPQLVDRGAGALRVSCYAAGRCVAADRHGRVLILHGGSWSKPVQRDRGGGGLRSIACTSASFCVAIDKRGHVIAFNGKGWRRSASLRGNGVPLDVSCAAGMLCAAVGVDDSGRSTVAAAWTLRSGHWSRETPWGNGSSNAVTCRRGFCAALDNEGDALMQRGQRWVQSDHAPIIGGGDLMTVSCGSSTFCVAGDLGGATFQWGGASWVAGRAVAGVPALAAISCTPGQFCLGSGGIWGRIAYDRGGHWVRANVFRDNAPEPVACTSSSFCSGFEYNHAETYNGTRWISEPLTFRVAPAAQESCVSQSLCVSVDTHGRLVTFNGRTWSRPKAAPPHWTGGGRGLSDVACSSATFCLGIGLAEVDKRTVGVLQSAVYNGHSWSRPTVIARVSVLSNGVSLACTAGEDCVLLDNMPAANPDDAALYAYSGGAWSRGHLLDPSHYAPVGSAADDQVSCTAAGFCAAISNDTGDVLWSPDPFAEQGR